MKYFAWVLLWAAIVLALCLMPASTVGTERIPLFEGADKMVHTGFFFVFTVLLYEALIRKQASSSPNAKSIILVLSLSILFAGLTEILQWKFAPSRSGDWWDFLADLIGIGMGTFSYLLLHRSKTK